MRTLTFFVFLFLLSQILSLATTTATATAADAAAEDILQETCRRCAAGSPNIDFDLCVSSLSSHPRSRSTNLRGLAVISYKLAISNATHTKHVLKNLLESTDEKDDVYVKSCMKTCMELYDDAITSLMEAIEAVREWRYDDANVYVSSAVDAPGTCEEGFADVGKASPVSKENEDLSNLAVIGLAITAILG